jgi:uncharacterized protein YycO
MIQWFKRTMIPITRYLGNLKSPWTVKLVDGDDYEKIKMIVRPGDIFVTRTFGHLSTIMIPGYWKHAAIMGPRGWVLEAISAGVMETDLVSFLTSKDEVCIVRPTFCFPAVSLAAAKAADALLGAKYDYEFSLGNRAFYCAELVYVAYKTVTPDIQFGPRDRLGLMTVTADDFFLAKTWFSPVYDSRTP